MRVLTHADAAELLLTAGPPARRTITLATRKALQTYLQAALRCPGLALDDPPRGGSIQLRVGSETLGTVDQVDDEGERSWVVTLVVLEDDLAG